MPHQRPPRPGSPSPVSRHPTPSVWQSCRALLSAPVPPMAGGPARKLNDPPPSLHPHARGFRTTTGWSAPGPRVGTLPLVGPPLAGLPWHRGDRFPRSPHKPGSRSRPLDAGRRSGRKQGAPALLLEERLAPVLTSSLRLRHLVHGSLALVCVIRT